MAKLGQYVFFGFLGAAGLAVPVAAAVNYLTHGVRLAPASSVSTSAVEAAPATQPVVAEVHAAAPITALEVALPAEPAREVRTSAPAVVSAAARAPKLTQVLAAAAADAAKSNQSGEGIDLSVPGTNREALLKSHFAAAPRLRAAAPAAPARSAESASDELVFDNR
jgi:hypothetical protein